MGKLTIQEIARVLTEKNGLQKREANRFVAEMFAIIQQQLDTDQIVKVKGLGTFKVVSVEARESVSVRTGERVTIDSHAKVVFTPDKLMSELVNKPFSQFETVVLNDGVEFDDMNEDADSVSAPQPELDDNEEPQRPSDAWQPSEQEAVLEDNHEKETVEVPLMISNDETADEEEYISPEPVTTDSMAPQENDQPTPDEPTEVSTESEADEVSTEDEANKAEATITYDDDDDEGRPWLRWTLYAVGVLALMALSAYGGYQYGWQQGTQAMTADSVAPRIGPSTDTIAVDSLKADSVQRDSLKTDSAALQGVRQDSTIRKTADSSQHPKLPTSANPASTAAADPYAAKDVRVRLGAYRIVGTDKEVTVRAGQTLAGISKSYLGPDMECYVEVYNDLPKGARLNAGQVIKIPKLALKKRKK